MTTSETKTEAKAEFEVAVMMAYCYSRRDRLGDWERSFVDDMHGKTRRPTLSLKQKSKLQDIYQRLGRSEKHDTENNPLSRSRGGNPIMSNARLVLEGVDKWGVAKAWTGRAYVWIVPDIGEDNECTDLFFDSHADAWAYVNALRAVEVTRQAALTLPEELIEELISDPQAMRRERQRESQYWTALAQAHNEKCHDQAN